MPTCLGFEALAKLDIHRVEQALRADAKTAPLKSPVTPLRTVPIERYNPDLSNHDDARDYVSAVDSIRHWIDNNL